jgi:hypothetical protein
VYVHSYLFTQKFLINLDTNFSSLFVTYDDVTEADCSGYEILAYTGYSSAKRQQIVVGQWRLHLQGRRF